MRWIWLRHGETEANTAGQYLGHTDSPLTQRGISQIDQAIALLSSSLTSSPSGPIRRVKLFSSDLGRCVQMAERFGAHLGVVPSLHAELRELDFGQWEGLTYDEIMAYYRATAESWYGNAFELAPPGGETLHELGARIDSWVARVQRCADSADTILVVSHGGPIRWFISRYVLGDEQAYWQVEGIKPGGLVVADYVDNQWRLGELDNKSAD